MGQIRITQPELVYTSHQHIIEIINTIRFDMFSVRFIKRTGQKEPRLMCCRRGVTKHLKGGSLKYEPSKYGLLGVFDMIKRGYRMINMDTVYELTYAGVRYRVPLF